MRRSANVLIASSVLLPLFLSAFAPSASAATVPSFYSDSLVVGGLSAPRSLDFFPNGTVLIVENNGGFVYVNGTTSTDIGTLGGLATSGEQGLLGVAIDPDYPARPYIYTHYTASGSPSYVQIARFNVTNATGPGPISIDIGSKWVLLGDIPNVNTNHNGGTVRFGPDKTLYISIGDDATGGCDAQNLSFMAGKILRIKVDATVNPANRATLAPSDNPFFGNASANVSLVWAYGLRNPFRFDVDPVSGWLFIGDVGQSAWEEVDVVRQGGLNMGWPYYEGDAAYRGTPCPIHGAIPPTSALTFPVYTFPNSGSAIIVPTVYRGVNYPNDASFPPEFEQNICLFDFYEDHLNLLAPSNNGTNWTLVPGVDSVNFATGMSYTTDMQVGPDGALWWISESTSQLRRIAHNPMPQITTVSLPAGSVGIAYNSVLAAAGGPLPLNWTIVMGALPAGLQLNATSGSITGVPVAGGNASFVVQVTTAAGRNATRPFFIDVDDPIPQIQTAFLPFGTVGVAYSAGLGATGGLQPFTWTLVSGALPDGLLLDNATATISGTPTAAANLSFVIQVNSSSGRAGTRGLFIEVADPVSIQPSALPDAVEGQSYAGPFAALGGVAPFTWSLSSGALPAGLGLSSSTGHITGTPTEHGNFSFNISVVDAQGRTASQALTLRVLEALAFAGSSLPSGEESVWYQATLIAIGGTPPFTFAVNASSALPANLTLGAANGTIFGTPASAQSVIVWFDVSDAGGQFATAAFGLVIAPPPGGPPLITTAVLPDATEGVAYSITLAAIEGTPPLSWAVETAGLPPGINFAPGQVRLHGTPTAVGLYFFNVTVTDNAARNDTRLFGLRVNAPARSIAITAFTLPDGELGIAYAGPTLAYTGVNLSAQVRWNATGLPAGIILDATAGTFSGASTLAGVFNVSITVRDMFNTGVEATRNATLRIGRLAIPATLNLPPLSQGVGVILTLVANGTSGAVEWSVVSGALPTGLVLDSNGTLRGTPSAPGNFTFTIRAARTGATATNFEDRTWTVSVAGETTVPPPPTPVPAPLDYRLIAALIAVLAVVAVIAIAARKRKPKEPADPEQ